MFLKGLWDVSLNGDLIEISQRHLIPAGNNDQIKANPNKYYFICSSSVKASIMIENEQIRNSSWEKIFGVFFDSRLAFQSHLENIFKKASQKLNVISRITSYMDLNKERLAVNAFFIAQFN